MGCIYQWVGILGFILKFCLLQLGYKLNREKNSPQTLEGERKQSKKPRCFPIPNLGINSLGSLILIQVSVVLFQLIHLFALSLLRHSLMLIVRLLTDVQSTFRVYYEGSS